MAAGRGEQVWHSDQSTPVVDEPQSWWRRRAPALGRLVNTLGLDRLGAWVAMVAAGWIAHAAHATFDAATALTLGALFAYTVHNCDRRAYMGRPLACKLGRNRLYLCYFHGLTALRYDEITAIDKTSDGAILVSPCGPIQLYDSLFNFDQLLTKLRSRAGLSVEQQDKLADRPKRQATVSPAIIEHWLACQPGGSLTGGYNGFIFMYFFAVAFAGLAIGMLIASAPWWALLCAVVAVATLWSAYSTSHAVGKCLKYRAKSDCLEIRDGRGWHTIPWDTIDSLECSEDGAQGVLRTRHGDFGFAGCDNTYQLYSAIRQSFDARSAGEVMPHVDVNETPETALSHAEDMPAGGASISVTHQTTEEWLESSETQPRLDGDEDALSSEANSQSLGGQSVSR